MRMPRKILVADGPQRRFGRALAAARPDLSLRVKHPKEMSAADLEWAEAYVGFRPPRQLDFAGADLRWVHSTGTGVDVYLLEGRLPAGALLTHTRGAFGPRIAEYCLNRMLMDAQCVSELERSQRERRWAKLETRELGGRAVLIIGCGRIGTHIARTLRALGCVVRGISRSGRANAAFEEVFPTAQLAAEVGRAEYLILIVPLTRETRHLIDDDALREARGVFLINVARGAIVDEGALVRALAAGRLRGAALDVFEAEPLKPDSPLWSLPGVWITPHLAARTTSAELVESFLSCLEALESGRVPDLAVDPRRGY